MHDSYLRHRAVHNTFNTSLPLWLVSTCNIEDSPVFMKSNCEHTILNITSCFLSYFFSPSLSLTAEEITLFILGSWQDLIPFCDSVKMVAFSLFIFSLSHICLLFSSKWRGCYPTHNSFCIIRRFQRHEESHSIL